MTEQQLPGSSKAALITGGARRIGAEVARRLHAEGYRVAIHFRDAAEEASILADAFNRTRPDSAITHKADLRCTDECRDAVDRVLRQWGRLDALVNNASAFFPTPLETATEADWDALAGSNMKGPFFLVQAASGALRARGGAVINLVDIYADRPLAGYSIYSAAKAGLVSLTRSLARELAPEVRVNAVAPGAILWSEHEDNEAARQSILRNIPLARMGTPWEIAAAVNFLLSGEAAYISGQVLAVDGGRSVVTS